MILYESKIRTLPRIGKGKVRDIYAVGSDKMLIVTSDRLSAFDVVLSDPIPDKGRVLNEMPPSGSTVCATSCRTSSPASTLNLSLQKKKNPRCAAVRWS